MGRVEFWFEFDMEFAEGRNISEELVVIEALAAAGLSQDALEPARTDEIKAALRENTEKARAAGVFGAPTFTAGDGEMFWGDDRLEAALDWAAVLGEG